MDLGWILHGFVQIWAWIWEITYQLTLLEWRLAWYWAIYLPWAGFPNQFVRNSISKRENLSIYGQITVIFRHFHGLSIAAKYDLCSPLFLQCFAKQSVGLVCVCVSLSLCLCMCVCVCVCVCLCDVMLWSVLDGGVMGRAWGGFFSPTLPWVNRCYRYQHCHGFSFAPGTHLTWDYFSHIWVLSQCVHRDKTLHCDFTICFDLGCLISTPTS